MEAFEGEVKYGEIQPEETGYNAKIVTLLQTDRNQLILEFHAATCTKQVPTT